MTMQPLSVPPAEMNGLIASRSGHSGGSPLGIILNPSGHASVIAGDQDGLELSITITNQGSISALIDIYIDEKSQPVRQWCVSPHEYLALTPGQSSEVVLKIKVPDNAIPDTYDYVLVVDAQQHYPENTPIYTSAKLQVMPYVEEARTATDATFTLQPSTSSQQPAVLQPGEQLELQVTVHNRSDRVDRFRLTCPDLDNKWFRIIYPEGLPEAGIITATQGLELNPGDKGEILLFFSPPMDAWAGVYAPTVRLYSENNPELVLLDVVYLEIAEFHLLNVDFISLVSKVKDRAGLFELRFQNSGNTVREIAINAKDADEENICTYTVAPPKLQLAPGGSAVTGIQVKPTRGRRPFYGRMLNFLIEIEDTQKLPLINDRFQGTLMWEPRPWWQFLLLIFLLTGSLAALIYFIFWLITKPPISPEIIQFSPEPLDYREVNDDAIRVNWRIANPEKIKTLTLVGMSPDGLVLSGPVVYDLSQQTLPKNLQDFCIPEPELICQNVWTNARKAGDYIFELTVTPKDQRKLKPVTLKTNSVRIEPIPVPQVVQVEPTQPVYQEAGNQPAALRAVPATVPGTGQSAVQSSVQSSVQSLDSRLEPAPAKAGGNDSVDKGDRILLNWRLNHPNQIKELRLIGLNPEGTIQSQKTYQFKDGNSPELEEYCQKSRDNSLLTCENVPTAATEPGQHMFEIQIIPTIGDGTPSAVLKTNAIEIKPIPLPKIVEFASIQPVYEEVKLKAATLAANQTGRSAQAFRESSPISSILLNWKIENGNQIQELGLMARSPDGRVNSPLKRYDFSQGIPTALRNYCVLNGNQLICNNFPTVANQPDDYIFELIILPKNQAPQSGITTKKTEPIKIKPEPVPINIVAFNINGQPAQPKYIFESQPKTKPIVLTLSWQVTGGQDMKVEILPAPGSVSPQGSVSYPVTPDPGAETITLKVSNGEGQELTRKVAIQTLAPPPPPPPIATGDATGDADAGAAGTGTGTADTGGATGAVGAAGAAGTGTETAGAAGGATGGAEGAAGGAEEEEKEPPTPDNTPLSPAEINPQFN